MVPLLLLSLDWMGPSICTAVVYHASQAVFIDSYKLLCWSVMWNGPLASLYLQLAFQLVAACWWIGTGLQGIFFVGTLGSSSIWYGSFWNLPNPVKQSGYKLIKSALYEQFHGDLHMILACCWLSVQFWCLGSSCWLWIHLICQFGWLQAGHNWVSTCSACHLGTTIQVQGVSATEKHTSLYQFHWNLGLMLACCVDLDRVHMTQLHQFFSG